MAVTERLDRPVAERAGPACTAAPVLVCRELRKRFDTVEAVRGVSFEIAPSEL